jgi:hypothetical protein
VRVRDRLEYLLIESPEPLDDEVRRLTMKVEGAATSLFPNLDMTRIVAALVSPITLISSAQVVNVELLWQGVISGAPVETRRTIGGVAAQETCLWQVPLKGLF